MSVFLVHESEVKPSSGDVQTEGSGKGFWYPEEFDRDSWRGLRTSIACQTQLPGKTVVCSLGTRSTELAEAESVETFLRDPPRRVGGAGA